VACNWITLTSRAQLCPLSHNLTYPSLVENFQLQHSTNNFHLHSIDGRNMKAPPMPHTRPEPSSTEGLGKAEPSARHRDEGARHGLSSLKKIRQRESIPPCPSPFSRQDIASGSYTRDHGAWTFGNGSAGMSSAFQSPLEKLADGDHIANRSQVFAPGNGISGEVVVKWFLYW
jgi:hypothetical protein